MTRTRVGRSRLDDLIADAVPIFWEVMATARRPVLRWNATPDGEGLVRLAQLALGDDPFPVPLLWIGPPRHTEAARRVACRLGTELVLHPSRGSQLAETLTDLGFDASIETLRREQVGHEGAMLAYRDRFGSLWPAYPEFWRPSATPLNDGQILRAFPLANWTEADVSAFVGMPPASMWSEPREQVEC